MAKDYVSPVISVKGLAQFSRGLRKLDSEAPKQLRIALNGVADVLVTRVRPKIPYRRGGARASLKARSTRTSARIVVGGTKARYYPWLDFGGQGRRSGRPGARPFIREGRYIYPTLSAITADIEKALEDSIRDVARSAGLDVD